MRSEESNQEICSVSSIVIPEARQHEPPLPQLCSAKDNLSAILELSCVNGFKYNLRSETQILASRNLYREIAITPSSQLTKTTEYLRQLDLCEN